MKRHRTRVLFPSSSSSTAPNQATRTPRYAAVESIKKLRTRVLTSFFPKHTRWPKSLMRCTKISNPEYISKQQKQSFQIPSPPSFNMKCIFLKLTVTAFAMLATASGVYASSDGDETSSTSHQTLRGSFLNEDEGADSGWWGRGRNNWNSGSGDLSTCTSNCQCPQGKAFYYIWSFRRNKKSCCMPILCM